MKGQEFSKKAAKTCDGIVCVWRNVITSRSTASKSCCRGQVGVQKRSVAAKDLHECETVARYKGSVVAARTGDRERTASIVQGMVKSVQSLLTPSASPRLQELPMGQRDEARPGRRSKGQR